MSNSSNTASVKNGKKTYQSPRTLGPVADLEKHLPDEWWRDLFNAVYLKTDGDVVENQEATAGEIDALLEISDMQPGDAVLDLCCGQGRHLMELAARGFKHLTGVDRSRYLVRLARRRAEKSGFQISFREGDARHARLPRDAFDFVTILGNSFGYFSSERDDQLVMETVLRSLKSSGQLILDLCDGAWMRENFERRSWEWIDQSHFVCRERSLSEDGDRLISREVITHAERGVIADQFYAERLYDRPRIEKLLDDAGFTNIEFLEAPSTVSTRNQDLGMLSQRILLRAQGPEKAAASRDKRAPMTVTVVLGDPSMPDPVKRGGAFNPEDIETINRLKAALEPLKDFEFQYFDRHRDLIDFLSKKRPQFVFNLCDEGYRNNAWHELHVPALLEMLDIPYTGGAPACLATCYDKGIVRVVAEALEIPVPTEIFFSPTDQRAALPTVFPAILKPGSGDSSIGITKDAIVHSSEELMGYLSHLRTILPGRSVLIQEFLQGAEYTVGLVGNPESGLRALPILEVDYSDLPKGLPHILGYESKWEPGTPYWDKIRYAQMTGDEDDQRAMVANSMKLFERLECRDYARFDYRRDSNGVIKLLEVNPNPGWCWDGKFNLMAEMGGYTYTEMLEQILRAAIDRTQVEAREQLRIGADRAVAAAAD